MHNCRAALGPHWLADMTVLLMLDGGGGGGLTMESIAINALVHELAVSTL
jgi:hypothetical protein